MAFYKHVLASANGLKTNDVIACSIACSPSLVRRRILFIASWESMRLCIFQWLKLYSVRKFSYGKCLQHL